MTKVVEAIYSHGMLQPLEPLELPESQRVELTVRAVENGRNSMPHLASTKEEREQLLRQLFEEIDRDNLQLRIHMPTRDEMHERG